MNADQIAVRLIQERQLEMIVTCHDAREADEAYVAVRWALPDLVVDEMKRGNGQWRIKLKNGSWVKFISRQPRYWTDRLRGLPDSVLVRAYNS